MANRLLRTVTMLRRHRHTLGAAQAAIAAGLLVLVGSAADGSARDVMLAEDATGSERARAAIASCLRAGAEASEQKRDELLTRGLAEAEAAAKESEQDPKAHFAVFCNLGRKLQSEGASLSAVAQIDRMKREIDRALALEPNFVDALAAKGAMLIQLPSLMGGDEAEGEKLIRRAVELAPDHPAARLELAKALAEKGEEREALSEAKEVVTLAQQRQKPAELREAQELADELQSS
jgi:hypothetical protein